MSGLSSRGYEARARECGLRTVRDSMEREDMIAVYRIVTSVDRSDLHQFFRPAVARPCTQPERVFSAMGWLLNKRRLCLSGGHVNAQLFLRENLK